MDPPICATIILNEPHKATIVDITVGLLLLTSDCWAIAEKFLVLPRGTPISGGTWRGELRSYEYELTRKPAQGEGVARTSAWIVGIGPDQAQATPDESMARRPIGMAYVIRLLKHRVRFTCAAPHDISLARWEHLEGSIDRLRGTTLGVGCRVRPYYPTDSRHYAQGPCAVAAKFML